MTDDQWCIFTVVVLVVDLLVIIIALWHMHGAPPALIGGWT